nr:hypothetical protein [Muricauda sp. CP2A]
MQTILILELAESVELVVSDELVEYSESVESVECWGLVVLVHLLLL